MVGQFHDFKARVLDLFADIDESVDAGLHGDIRKLIDSIRGTLAKPDQQLGAWEAAELNDADQALQAGYARLALISVARAVAVSELADDEYVFGFKLARHRLDAEA